MADTLELPNGDVVSTDDVFLYNDYPYRYVPRADDRYAFELVPLYWGGGDMDVPFPDRTALDEQWEPAASGTLDESEWRAWIRDKRGDDTFGAEELDALERELLGGNGGLLASLREVLGGSG